MFISYKNQETVNLDYVAFLKVEGNKIMFIFEKVMIRVNWNFETEEEAKQVYKEIKLQIRSVEFNQYKEN